MVKIFCFGSFLLLCFAFLSVLPPTVAAAAVVEDDAWVSLPTGVSCTMCSSCDNPCHPLLSPPPTLIPSPPPPISSSNNPPPTPSPYPYASPPPPSGYYNPPPSVHYPGPPPPHPIMPYFPFYFYSPPPPSKTFSGCSLLAAPFASSLQLLLLVLPLLLFF